MKGAILYASSIYFVACAAAAAKLLPRTSESVGNYLSIRGDQLRMFLLYSVEDNPLEIREEEDPVEGALRTEELHHPYLIECRAKDLFCSILADLARAGVPDFRILDMANRLWRPEELCPAEVKL